MGNCCGSKEITSSRVPMHKRPPTPQPQPKQIVTLKEKEAVSSDKKPNTPLNLPIQQITVDQLLKQVEKSPKPILNAFQVSSQQLLAVEQSQKKEQVIPSHRSNKQAEQQVFVSPRNTQMSLKFGTVNKNKKIYKITTTFPIVKPYAKQEEFEKVISKYRLAQQGTMDKKFVPPEFDKLSEQILQLNNRNWIQDLINTHQQYIATLKGNSFESLVKNKRLIQLREQFNWFVWALAHQYFKSYNLRKDLPKQDSQRWSEGFSFKGIFVQLLPIEEANHIVSEMRGLSQIQIELNQLLCCSESSKIANQMIVPLITTVKCGAFIIYGTPVIYTQEVSQLNHEDFSRRMSTSEAQQTSYDEPGVQFQLPRISSMTAATVRVDIESLLPALDRRQTFTYLHQNLANNENFASDIVQLQTMPALKNVTSNNLIPVVDFEKLQSKPLATNAIEISYLVTYVSSYLQSMSQEATSSALFVIPTLPTDEIKFKTFPADKMLDISLIQRYLSSENGKDGTSGSMKPKGDVQQSPQNSPKLIEPDSPSIPPSEKEVQKQILTKHGWNIMLIQLENTTYVRTAENRRATQILQLSRASTSINTGVHKSPAPKQMQNQLTGKKQSRDNFPLMSPQVSVKSPSLISSQQIKPNAYSASDESNVFGSCLLNAQTEKMFRVLPALSQNEYVTPLEILYKQAIQKCADTLNSVPEKFSNERAVKGLMHRKGLNMRFLWLILLKLTIQRSRQLVMVCIMLRVMKKVVFGRVAQKCRNDLSSLVTPSAPPDKRQSYNAANQETMKESVCMFLNAILKNKFAKYKSTFDETLLGLFLHRLKVVQLSITLKIQEMELNYLESRDILDQVLECPSTSATLFLNSVQTYFNLQFTNEFCRNYRQDIYNLLNKSQPVTVSDFKAINLTVETVLTLREQAYFLLAHKETQVKQRKVQGTTKEDLSKVFNRSISDRSYRAADTDRSVNTSRQNQQNLQQLNQPVETFRNFKNLPPSTNQSFNFIDLSKKGQRDLSCEFIFPSSLYRTNPQAQQNCLLQSNYEAPSVDVLNEWVMILESLQKDCFSVCYDNSDQVLVEALSLQAISSFLLNEDSESCFKILDRIRAQLLEATSISPEHVCLVMIITAMWSESSPELELIDSEKSYIAAMICLFQFLGDPRGRGNIGQPIMMLIAWKLQLIALSGKKMQDSELAEEIFDACLSSCTSHKKQFKTQVEQVVLAQEKAYRESEVSQVRMSNSVKNRQSVEQLSDQTRQSFDIKKYKNRPRNVLTAGGFVKSSAKHPILTDTENKQTQRIHSMQKQRLLPSQVSHLQKQNVDADLSDIEIEIRENGNDSYFSVKGTTQLDIYNEVLPFPHWMINRQIYQQQLLSVKKEKVGDQKEILDNLLRETLTKLQPQTLMSWLISYLPIQFTSGIQWDSQTAKEFLFGQNNQMLSNSGSSAGFSQSGRSQVSQRYKDGLQASSSTQRRRYLGPYTQIFGKEVGGIQKSEISGQLYLWGTDSQGQLGLDHFCPQQKQTVMQNAALKLLHPRLCIALKDEVIKEICCGYSFTLAVNLYGQMFSWGANECGQLGLGPTSMNQLIFRTPQPNPYLTSVSKLSAGNEHCLALSRSGELFVWGSANLTGLNDVDHRSTPTLLDNFTESRALQISCGGLHSMVLTKQGEVYTWGSNEGGQLGLDNRFEHADCVKKPTLIESLVRMNIFVTQIACGETHSIVLAKDSKVFGWGMSMYGQLGLGFSADSFEPGIGLAKSKVLTPVEITPYLPLNVKIVHVFCGAAFTLLKTQDGELYGCGINDLGQLGLDTYVEDMQLALLDRQKVKKGSNSTSSDVTVPSKVICFEKMNVHSVACGENHSLAVIGEEKNMLWSWGIYKNGQLGLGEVTMKMNPRPVQTLCSSQIHSIAAGSMHSAALLGDQQQLNHISHSFFLNTDMLYNPWIIDVRKLSIDKSYLSPSQNRKV